MNLTRHLHHFAVEVDDLDASIQWYEEKLGFRIERRFRLEEARLDMAYLTSGAVRVELLKRSGPAAAQREGPARMHICFEVDDLEAAADELRRRGVVLAQEVKVIEPAGVKNCWIEDPAGCLIEFVEVLG